MGGIQSKPEKGRSMQVLGMGYSRSGTVSMQMALTKLLNGPVVHGATHGCTAGDRWLQTLIRAMDAKLAGDKERCMKYISQAYDGFVACTDFPAFFMLPELMELYPDAKVVLVTRDPEKWWKSIEPLFGTAYNSWALTLPRILPGMRHYPESIRDYMALIDQSIRRTKDKLVPYGPYIIEKHNQMVIDMVPKERLLVMKLGDGWGPLCEFLGKPVPNEPFPRANETEFMNAYIKKLYVEMIALWIAAFGGVAGCMYLVWRFARGQSLL